MIVLKGFSMNDIKERIVDECIKVGLENIQPFGNSRNKNDFEVINGCMLYTVGTKNGNNVKYCISLEDFEKGKRIELLENNSIQTASNILRQVSRAPGSGMYRSKYQFSPVSICRRRGMTS
jgi:hypothetical protein